MITRKEFEDAQSRSARMIRDAGIVISDEEANSIEVVDFGLSHLGVEGAQILTLTQTQRLSIKLLALFANQTEPEHWHPPYQDDPGKEETVRVISGSLLFYLPDETGSSPQPSTIPAGKEHCYTCYKEIIMNPGDQLTLSPGVKHWFKSGPDGSVFYSISTVARDALDKFTDPTIKRITRIVDQTQ